MLCKPQALGFLPTNWLEPTAAALAVPSDGIQVLLYLTTNVPATNVVPGRHAYSHSA